MNAKVGRPEFVIDQQVIDKAESLASRGLTLEQVANCLGICYQTLNEKRKEYSEFSDAIKRGQHKGISIVANSLFDSAKNGNTTAQIFYLKARAGWKEAKDTMEEETQKTLLQNLIDKL